MWRFIDHVVWNNKLLMGMGIVLSTLNFSKGDYLFGTIFAVLSLSFILDEYFDAKNSEENGGGILK